MTFASCVRWGLCLLLVLAARSAGAACTSADATCGEWIVLGGGPARALVYRSHALDARNDGVRRALVMVHGQGRDADLYFRSALAAAFLAGALENTVVVAPRFASSDDGRCRDALAANELNWGCLGADSWRNGAHASVNAQVTSYDVVDEIVRRVTRTEVFPNLKTLVVAGHSAGGQLVGRYAMANQVHDRLPLRPTYIVANPSSYTYLDSLRPTASALPPNVAAAAPGYILPRPAEPPPPFAAFADATACTTYDSWPYGLKQRNGYSARLTDDQLKQQIAQRPLMYVLGELDILPLYGFDGSCPAMAQGPTRLARGLAFAKYVNEHFGAQHKVLVVPACGHSARCMFTSERVLPLIFPKE